MKQQNSLNKIGSIELPALSLQGCNAPGRQHSYAQYLRRDVITSLWLEAAGDIANEQALIATCHLLPIHQALWWITHRVSARGLITGMCSDVVVARVQGRENNV